MIQDKTTQAKNLYLHTDKTQKEIADILDVNSKTLYLWIRNGQWDLMKQAARQAPNMILQDLYNHIDSINRKVATREDTCPTPQEVDMIRKLINSSRHIQKFHVGSYLEAFQELMIYIKSVNPIIHIDVVKIADEYVRGKLGQSSSARMGERVRETRAALLQMEKENATLTSEDADIHRAPETESTPTEPISDQVDNRVHGTSRFFRESGTIGHQPEPPEPPKPTTEAILEDPMPDLPQKNEAPEPQRPLGEIISISLSDGRVIRRPTIILPIGCDPVPSNCSPGTRNDVLIHIQLRQFRKHYRPGTFYKWTWEHTREPFPYGDYHLLRV